jgi:hypothetical protein
VSAWNDHGMRENKIAELRRTNIFPGLGWMLKRELWEVELREKWPDAYWDDWMRENNQTKGRDCVYPSVSRTKTFGSQGSSFGLFFDEFLKNTVLNSQNIDWKKQNLDYLEKSNWDKNMFDRIEDAKMISSLSELDSNVSQKDFRILFSSSYDYEKIAKQLHLMEDLKLGQPRGSHNGVLAVYLAKTNATLFVINANHSSNENSKLKLDSKTHPTIVVSDSKSVSKSSICPSECICDAKQRNKGPFYLVGFVNVRCYPNDKQKWTTVEFFQWLQYMKWSGVEKMYVYDNYNEPEERQLTPLKPFIDCGFVEYFDWSHKHPFDLENTQMHAYYDGLKLLAGIKKSETKNLRLKN